MNKIQDDQYVTVHGWMRTQLGLKANELWLYALIYSFNKATKKEFYGSNAYMQEWLGVSHNTIREALKRLVAKGLLVKRDAVAETGSRCYYKVNLKPLGIRHINQEVHFKAKAKNTETAETIETTETGIQNLEPPSQNSETAPSKTEEGVYQNLETPSSETGANNNTDNDIETDIHNKLALQSEPTEATIVSTASEASDMCVDFNKILNEAYIKTGGNVLATANYMYIDGLYKTITATDYSSLFGDDMPF